MSPQRQFILHVVASMRGDFSADQVYRQVAARFRHVSISTVYRTLDLLEEQGVVRRTNHHDGRFWFERADRAATSELLKLRSRSGD